MTRWTIAALAVLVAVTAGCASPATREGMTVADVERLQQHPYAVRVVAEGGPETSRGDSAAAISNDDLAVSIAVSIRNTGVFAQVVEDEAGDYLLSATLIHVRKPFMGFTMTADVEITWSLTDLRDEQVVWREALQSSATAGVGDAFAAATRVRIVTEAAVRNNIRDALARIARLDLAGEGLRISRRLHSVMVGTTAAITSLKVRRTVPQPSRPLPNTS